MSSLQLDVLLAQTRETEPVDDGFSASVMRDIESLDVVAGSRLTALRRPMVAITATAVVLTGGAVAALVGTQIANNNEGGATSEPRASVSVSSGPDVSTNPKAGGAHDATASRDSDLKAAIDGSAHTISVVDPNTGLRLQTDTRMNEFQTGTPQRVTLTLTNTSEKPLAITEYKDCSLQVMAFQMGSAPAGENQTPAEYYDHYRNEEGVERVCAGSGTTPRAPTAAANAFVLQPGATHSSDAMLTLPSDGNWGVMGICSCDGTEAGAPAPKDNPFGDFKSRVLPFPLITLDVDTGEATITPPIRVTARSD